jgi:hypothetical protein
VKCTRKSPRKNVFTLNLFWKYYGNVSLNSDMQHTGHGRLSSELQRMEIVRLCEFEFNWTDWGWNAFSYTEHYSCMYLVGRLTTVYQLQRLHKVSGDFMSVLPDFIPVIMPIHNCHTNVSSIFNGHRAKDILNSRWSETYVQHQDHAPCSDENSLTQFLPSYVAFFVWPYGARSGDRSGHFGWPRQPIRRSANCSFRSRL